MINSDEVEIFESYLEKIKSNFKVDFGALAFQKIEYQINRNSKANMKLRDHTLKFRVAPSSRDLIGLVSAIPYFMIRRNTTSKMGALILLEKWYHEVCIPNSFEVIPDLIDTIHGVFRWANPGEVDFTRIQSSMR